MSIDTKTKAIES